VVGPPAKAQEKKPNIVVITSEFWNIGAYHQGLMAGRKPNLDKLASEEMRFANYYTEASCTAVRANFIAGELPIRTGMTTVGQVGAAIGIPAQAVTIATALKSMGYATGHACNLAKSCALTSSRSCVSRGGRSCGQTAKHTQPRLDFGF
jgi:arylsulfatase